MEADTALWQRVQEDDPGAFAELYRRHLRGVLAFCLRRTADPQQAEDLAATAFFEAWRQRHRLRLTCETARPLLLGIANNLLRHHWRARHRHAEALARLRGTAGTAAVTEDDAAIARLDAKRALREAHKALQSLPRREREVLSLIAWSELTYEEAAVALQIPVGTVRSRLARARKRLGESLPGDRLPPLAVEATAGSSERASSTEGTGR